MLAEPSQKWQIVSSQKHSTVWNGKHVLFDFNFQAMGITPEECWDRATDHGRVLEPGKYLRVYYAPSFREDDRGIVA